jgi:hypothetical protein
MEQGLKPTQFSYKNKEEVERQACTGATSTALLGVNIIGLLEIGYKAIEI